MNDSAIGTTLIDQDSLATRIRDLGAEISRDYAGRELFLVGVLKGAVFFIADLMRELELHCAIDFMAVASYGSSTDIVDSGLTLSYLLRTLRARNPATLEVCALLTKPERLKVKLPIRYVGFEIPNRFAIGYGLDFDERYRNLPYVAALDADEQL
jgi:hypoxanthine phosphoribosyltransferase